jgi:hypothetical protein
MFNEKNVLSQNNFQLLKKSEKNFMIFNLMYFYLF